MVGNVQETVGFSIVITIFVFMVLNAMFGDTKIFKAIFGSLTGSSIVFFLIIAIALFYLIQLGFGRLTVFGVIAGAVIMVGLFIFVPELDNYLPNFSIVIQELQSIVPGVLP